MPPIEQLTEHSLREFGLGGTILVLIGVFLIVYKWKMPPKSEHLSPMHSVEEKVRLIPLLLEEVRAVARDMRVGLDEAHQLGRDMRHGLKNQDEIMERLERVETTQQIIKDRQRRE